jgi:hypothetical protein
MEVYEDLIFEEITLEAILEQGVVTDIVIVVEELEEIYIDQFLPQC